MNHEDASNELDFSSTIRCDQAIKWCEDHLVEEMFKTTPRLSIRFCKNYLFSPGPNLVCFDGLMTLRQCTHMIETIVVNCKRLNLQVSRVEVPEDTFEWEGQTVSNRLRNKAVIHLEMADHKRKKKG